MKSTLVILGLCLLASCSTVKPSKEKVRLSERIQSEEARSIQEIKSHTELLLDEHPELDDVTRNELKEFLNVTMTRHQQLKDDESRIFQLLLQKSIRINSLTAQELKDKRDLKKSLSEVYKEKSNNVHTLINKMVELSNKNQISESFKDDMWLFMRDFR